MIVSPRRAKIGLVLLSLLAAGLSGCVYYGPPPPRRVVYYAPPPPQPYYGYYR